jgi:hypothetical protein
MIRKRTGMANTSGFSIPRVAPFNVFISHGTVDRASVEQMKATLEKRGITCYLFEHDIQPGQLISNKLQRNIDNCDAFIILLTANSHGSPCVNQELGYAIKAKKIIIPLMEKAFRSEKASMLDGVEYISFDREHPDEALAQLRTFLDEKVSQKDLELYLAVAAVAIGLVMLWSLS